MRMAVKRRVGGREDHRPVEERQDFLAAAGLVAIPQLEVAAVVIAPLFVEIHEQVQAAIELQLRMDVEVRVDLEKAAGLDLVQTAAAEVGIRNQSFDACERLQPQ